MRYTWDPSKAESNERDHQVNFTDAVSVFRDDYGLSQEDRSVHGEDRYVTVGINRFGQVLVVVYIYRGDEETRIISARRATRRERRLYEQNR